MADRKSSRPDGAIRSAHDDVYLAPATALDFSSVATTSTARARAAWFLLVMAAVAVVTTVVGFPRYGVSPSSVAVAAVHVGIGLALRRDPRWRLPALGWVVVQATVPVALRATTALRGMGDASHSAATFALVMLPAVVVRAMEVIPFLLLLTPRTGRPRQNLATVLFVADVILKLASVIIVEIVRSRFRV